MICCTAALCLTKFAMKEEFTATAKLIIVQKSDSATQQNYTYSREEYISLINRGAEGILSLDFSDSDKMAAKNAGIKYLDVNDFIEKYRQ